MKLLILLCIVFGVIYLLRHRSVVATRQRVKSPHNPQRTISMVQCEHCGVHLPENEAIIRQGHIWCSPEHEQLGKKAS